MVFIRYLSSFRSTADLEGVREKILSSGVSQKLKDIFLTRFSAVYELQGRFRDAADLLALRSDYLKEEGSLLRLGHLWIEAGDFDNAEMAGQYLSVSTSQSMRESGAVLLGRILRMKNLKVEARDGIEIASAHTLGIPSPVLLWELAQYSDNEKKLKIKNILSRYYPGNMESEILDFQEYIRYWGIKNEIEIPKIPQEPEFLIQVGAFGSLNNAKKLLTQMKEYLVDVEILSEQDLFKVMIHGNTRTLELLKEKNIPFILKN